MTQEAGMSTDVPLDEFRFKLQAYDMSREAGMITNTDLLTFWYKEKSRQNTETLPNRVVGFSRFTHTYLKCKLKNLKYDWLNQQICLSSQGQFTG